jgi:hypothetical protein
MGEPRTDHPAGGERLLAELTGEDARAAAFLSACVAGEVAEATVGDRIAAARALLEHAGRLPDLLGELAGGAELATGDDVASVVDALG